MILQSFGHLLSPCYIKKNIYCKPPYLLHCKEFLRSLYIFEKICFSLLDLFLNKFNKFAWQYCKDK